MKQNKNRAARIIAALLAMTLLLCAGCSKKPAQPDTSPTPDVSTHLKNLDVGSGLEIVSAGSYAGLYVEDGSDEAVSDVFCIFVKNNGESDVEYAHIVLSGGSDSFEFDISTLPVGATVQALELSRQSKPENTAQLTGAVTLFAAFDEPISTHDDMFEITTSGSTVTVKNLTDTDFSQVYICYKNANGDTLVGGISYRCTIGALAAGESKSGATGHLSEGASRLMFVGYVQ